METEGMELEIIINPKTTDDGQAVIQVRFCRPFSATWRIFGLIQYLRHTFPTPSTARDRRRCSDQALQERTLYQRTALTFLARQVVLGLVAHQERHLFT